MVFVSLNIVGGEILTFPDTLTTQGLSLWSLNIVVALKAKIFRAGTQRRARICAANTTPRESENVYLRSVPCPAGASHADARMDTCACSCRNLREAGTILDVISKKWSMRSPDPDPSNASVPHGIRSAAHVWPRALLLCHSQPHSAALRHRRAFTLSTPSAEPIAERCGRGARCRAASTSVH